MMKRTTELRRAIKALVDRIGRLVKEAEGVEDGKVELRKKFDADETFLGREETHKFQPSAAVGYWREIREQEERLDEKRSELRALEARDAGEPIHVEIHFDGPGECASDAPTPGVAR